MRKEERVMRVGKERMTPSGLNPPPPPSEWEREWMTHEANPPVPHEDVDNDVQRKQDNNNRHSSYKR